MTGTMTQQQINDLKSILSRVISIQADVSVLTDDVDAACEWCPELNEASENIHDVTYQLLEVLAELCVRLNFLKDATDATEGAS